MGDFCLMPTQQFLEVVANGNTLPMLSSDSIDNTAKSKADSERKQGVNDKI